VRNELIRAFWVSFLLLACTHQGGAPVSPRATATDLAIREVGQSVFRYETFGNERFYSEILGLDEGLSRRGITTNTLLATGVQLDGDKLPSEFLLVNVGDGVYGDPSATRRLIEANAVIGLVVRGGRVGITCALCHSRADDRIHLGVGRPMDGVPNTRLRVGELMAWGERSRAYLPFVNVAGTGSGPRVDLDMAADSLATERAVDAALRAWPRGQADILPDGVGNPTDIPSLFVIAEHGPYLWDGSFSGAADTSQFFATVVLDPTVLATRPGRAYLSDGPFWPVGDSLGVAYQTVLQAIDPEAVWPRAAIFRASVFGLFHDPLDARFRVNRADIAALTKYLSGVFPPEPALPGERTIDSGRRVFRRSGCSDCHLEARGPGGAVVPLATLAPEYIPAPKGEDGVRTYDIAENPSTGFDDRIALAPGEDSIARRGYKVPMLLGLWLSAPYLHDGSVATLEALFSPERGPGAPHPYFVERATDREDLAAFLRVWDGRKYP
jgi:hypothetical protein